MSGINIDENKIVEAVMKALQGQISEADSSALAGALKAGDNPDDGELPDITAIPENDICLVDSPKNREAILRLKRTTPARTATGRIGDREKALIVFRKKAAHAGASDAVWDEADLSFAEANNIPVIESAAGNKEQYLMRPDLGVKVREEDMEVVKNRLKKNPDVQIILGEGQSNLAIQKGLPELYPALIQGLEANGIDYGTPVFVKYTRVGVGDYISDAVGAKISCVILGERPGLLSWNSLSVYLTYGAKREYWKTAEQ